MAPIVFTIAETTILRSMIANFSNMEYSVDEAKKVFTSAIKRNFPNDSIGSLMMRPLKDGIYFLPKCAAGNRTQYTYVLVNAPNMHAYRLEGEAEAQVSPALDCCTFLEIMSSELSDCPSSRKAFWFAV